MADETGWYFVQEGRSVGPDSTEQLLELLDQGTITRQTQVWRQGAAEWQSLEIALGLTVGIPPAIPGTPSGMPPIPPTARTATIPPTPTGAYPNYEPHPWRRYFARMLDTIIGAAAIFFAIGVVLVVIDQDALKAFTDFFDKSDNRILNTILTVAVAMLPNAIFIGFTGSSLGKWIFGVSVTHMDGRVIGFRLALHREFMVWWRGLGIGIPIVSLFTLISAFRTLKEKKKTSWDEELFLKVIYRQATTKQMILNFVGVGLWLIAIVALVALNSV